MKMFSSLKSGRCWQTIKSLPAIIFALLLVGAAIPTFAVHDVALFELDTRAGMEGDQDKKNDPIPDMVGDGNTADEAADGDDWENVYLGTDSADVTSFIEDTFANNNIDNGAQPFVALRTPEISFFTGGGSKDTNGIQDGPWKYKVISDQVPDKNDIVNAFAALYSQEEGDPILYFGLDTFSVNGDANAGFWFFRDDVSLAPLGEGENTGTFIGEHRDGDLFVAVAYTQGGRVGDIDVYQWSGDDATGSLVLMESGQDCATVGADDPVCGVINKLLPDQTFGEDPVFDYANTLVANNPLDPTSYQYESAAFVEFGLVLDETLFPNGIGCFSTFMAETRSSQSETAQLKDLALGNFDVCSIDVAKTGDGQSKVGDDVDYSITVTNTGLATLYKQSITDTLLGDLSDDAGCGASLAPGASCVINVSRTVLAGDSDPLPNTVTVVYTEFADPASLEFTANDDHEVDLFQPAIDVDKTGDALSKVGDDIDYTVTLSNNSSDDTPALNCIASDSYGGTIFDGVLAAGNTVLNYSYTVQAGDPDPLVNTVSMQCTVDTFGNILNASDDHSTDLFQPAIDVAKTGDDLSKVGDDVDYTITLSNNSSAGTPDLNCVATDDLMGEVFNGVLPAGDTVINTSRTVQAGDPDPLVNTVTMDCTVAGFGNALTDYDSHSTNLFQPAIDVAKTGDALSKVGDLVDYSITLSNNSSGDTPAMECVATDSLLGEVYNGVLPLGDTVIAASRTVQAGDADPLINTVTMNCTVGGGFGNALSDNDSHSTNLFQPSVAIDKTADCDAGVPIGADITYSYLITNTSSGDTPSLSLASITDDKIGDLSAAAAVANCDSLASGESCNFNATYNTSGLPVGIIMNTVNVLYNPVGWPNDVPASDDYSCDIVLPEPATVVIEKVLLNAEGSTFNYSSNGIQIAAAWDETLMPLFAPVPPQNVASPFAPAGAGNGFATTIELVVNVPDITQTSEATVEELLPLPDQIYFNSLSCSAAIGGNLSGYTVVDKLATLTLGSGDFAFCRYVNEFIPGDEGCTPGFWKNSPGSWDDTAYATTDLVEDIFQYNNGVAHTIPGSYFSGNPKTRLSHTDTLMDALDYEGGDDNEKGAAKILLRAATAAILNATHSGVNYTRSADSIIMEVVDALETKDRDIILTLATELDWDNNLGCPLSNDNSF
ncbi:hypothetical protein KDX31_19675 (plasmid) [Amphritea atlantica]|uniref:DUF7507 domain-containing protein n=1 Tax=Amphritea atlantica TaxID=355243 RepID=A0ABY5H0N2_9GAMM|nr:hypothetical protein KDX31_19675 [Amphritea atlantica]